MYGLRTSSLRVNRQASLGMSKFSESLANTRLPFSQDFSLTWLTIGRGSSVFSSLDCGKVCAFQVSACI